MAKITPTPPPAPDLEKNSPAPSTVWRRMMGAIYEGLLLIGPLFVLVFIYSVVTGFGQGAANPGDPATPGGVGGLGRYGLQLVISASLLAYFTWGWSRGRCTLPMQTLGLRVVRADSSPVSPGRALVRALIAGPSFFSGLGIIWALIDRDSQSIHDRLTDTRLVHVPVKKII
jgi:uncharacterized RDD family membrane protein YckC